LFIDEARTAIKKKLLNSKFKFLKCERLVEPSLASSLAGINFSSNVWVISIDKDSMPGKLVLIKQLD
jgi:hypothetical protein